MTTATAPTGQELYDYAVANSIPLAVLAKLIGALKSPDPVASLTWLIDVETDDRVRRGLTAGLDVLRDRGSSRPPS